MSEENNDNVQEEEKKGLGKKKILLIFLGIVLVISITFVVLFFFVFSGDKDKDPGDKNNQKAGDEKAGPGIQDFYPDLLKMPEIKIKLTSEEGSEVEKYLRLGFYIKLKNPADKYILLEKIDVLKKDITELFQPRKPSEIDDLYEKILLKKEMVRKISDILKKDTVENVYFTEFLILDW